jgi:signal transduction histidine kinase/ligand-binding sensor domain-containing protein
MRIMVPGFFLLFSLTVYGQTMRFSHLDQKQGLSQNSPTAFLQDRDGFIWVGTQDGLNRYDGYSFTVYRTVAGDTHSLCDNFILCLAEDTDGTIWIGTRNGLCAYRKDADQFYRYYFPGEDRKQFHANIRLLFAKKNGGIVYKTLGGKLFSVKFQPFSAQFASQKIMDSVQTFAYNAASDRLAFIKKGVIGFCTAEGTVSSVQYEWKPAGRSAPTVLFENELVYINDSSTVIAYDSRQQSQPGVVYTSSITKVLCMALLPGQLWIGTDNGLHVLSLSDRTSVIAREDPTDFFSLSGNRIESVYRSKQNIMWIGTVGGVNIYDPLQTRFKTLRGEIPFRNSSEPVWFVMSCGNTVLWACDDGLNYETSAPQAPEWVRLIPTDLRYNAGCFDSRGRLWLGTKYQGLVIVDTVQNTVDKRFLHATAFLQSTIMDIRPDGRGSMWIAALGSLSTISEDDLELNFISGGGKTAPGIRSHYFVALARDEQNRMYVATANGLMHFALDDSSFVLHANDPANSNSLCYNILNDIELIGNKLWIASMGSGLDCFDPGTKAFTHYTTREGLANNTIYGIENDAAGKLWLSTNEGLVVLDPASGASRNYTLRDGLPSNEFVLNKHARNSEDGTLYFGSASGIVSFHPGDFTAHQSAAKPVITRMLVNYKTHLFSPDSVLQLSADERNITVEFAAIDFRNQDKIRYEYRLNGFDTSWHAANASNRLAVYTNLPYGSYTLEVRHKISGEEWSADPLQLQIEIATPYYATTWFRALMLVVIVTLIGLVVRYISQRKLRKQLEVLRVQEQIRNEKERISRDLHDNVGAQLTYVISSLDNLSYTLQRKQVDAESEKLEQLGEFARGTMDQLRESIWAINSEQIRLSELAARWKQYLSQLADTRSNFSGQLLFEGTDQLLKPSAAIEVHRIVQEAISNAFRHSGGNTIRVEVDIENNRLSVSVIDNGQGMSEHPEKEGHYGLRNMKERTSRINGDLSFRTGETGTTVHLSWPSN